MTLHNESSPQPPTRTVAVLAAADIPPSKLGTARGLGLSGPERRLYTWILRRFATRGRPSSSEARAYARRVGLDEGRALESLAREDLVHRGDDGEIAVAYPFSGRPTAHRVRFPSGHEAYAMCAIDALGIAPMFDQRIEVASHDPLTREEVVVRVAPSLDAEWQPSSAVVFAGAFRGKGDSCSTCCPVLNFFASAANADRWLADQTKVGGETVSMREAVLAGATIFGNVLTQPPAIPGLPTRPSRRSA